MSVSVADIFEEYVESLQNLPAEIDQNMHELRSMDEEFQRVRETYTKHRRSYAKALKNAAPNHATNLSASRSQLEKEYQKALQKQDEKIELALRMYDLVSRHIERIDSQMAKSGIDGGDWIGNRASSNRSWEDRWRNEGQRKRSIAPSSFRKRAPRPTPATSHHGTLTELEIDPNEPRYCICNQVSFGDMVACDGENCEKEWFHYACVGLVEPPAGKWFCDDCAAEDGYRKRIKRLSEDIA
ncbi:inhibitor of growth protein 4 [Lichtheimia corymbifera JMRC:FSU:9682]|uniref:Chromatin modification-related protein n=1 Tax=Lichtheimia corymbifera JMRC:FSU:9682 TaxID=1263082 RepID=A0A068RN56_9FUNG|nr:inhibitor of growth protein 4 [Lichtheimia corymbifera JMRC:FSU:9682]